jgi:hypothetical protein
MRCQCRAAALRMLAILCVLISAAAAAVVCYEITRSGCSSSIVRCDRLCATICCCLLQLATVLYLLLQYIVDYCSTLHHTAVRCQHI